MKGLVLFLMLICAIAIGGTALVNAIWPVDRHPMIIDAQATACAPPVQTYPLRPIPVQPSDARRIV